MWEGFLASVFLELIGPYSYVRKSGENAPETFMVEAKGSECYVPTLLRSEIGNYPWIVNPVAVIERFGESVTGEKFPRLSASGAEHLRQVLAVLLNIERLAGRNIDGERNRILVLGKASRLAILPPSKQKFARMRDFEKALVSSDESRRWDPALRQHVTSRLHENFDLMAGDFLCALDVFCGISAGTEGASPEVSITKRICAHAGFFTGNQIRSALRIANGC